MAEFWDKLNWPHVVVIVAVVWIFFGSPINITWTRGK